MPKIKVKNPIVDINGDEMARVIWDKIRESLILPFLDINLLEFDLSLVNRNNTDDQVTIEAAKAIKKNNVGVKCATITPDDKRIIEYNLKRKYPSPNGTIRNILNGTIFREPIIIKNIPKIVNHWNESVVIARHAFGDIYKSREIDIKKNGKLTLNIESADKKEVVEETIFDFDSPGVGISYFNIDSSIRDFAYSCFNFALNRKIPIFLSTKNTILQKYDERFKNIFEEVYEKKFKKKFQENHISYQHRLIDDMVACMTSVLQSPDGKIIETEAAHGTVTSHYRQHQNGLQTSTNPIASIFAWTRALSHRGELDKNIELEEFAKKLESICIETLENGEMTKDLALMVGPEQKWVNTTQLFETIKNKLEN